MPPIIPASIPSEIDDPVLNFRDKGDLEILVASIAGAIFKLGEPAHGGHAITREQAFERARNIVAGPVTLVCQDAYDSGYSEATIELSGKMASFSAASVAGGAL
jgi:hypothetical protein